MHTAFESKENNKNQKKKTEDEKSVCVPPKCGIKILIIMLQTFII